MLSWGLLILAVIQLGTAVSALFSARQESYLGVKTLREELSLYRYLLTSLWLSVGTLYLVGAFVESFLVPASLIGVINVVLEIIGYFLGFRWIPNVKWYPYAGALVMGIPGVMCLMNLL